MYIERWEDFYAAAEELYVADPLRTRYVAKYRHCDGKLVLKVTDDKTVRMGRWGRQCMTCLCGGTSEDHALPTAAPSLT